MTQTYINHKTAKLLKEFLNESAPEPMVSKYWRVYIGGVCPILVGDGTNDSEWRVNYAAYQLHDLLSKPFCEAMANKTGELEKDGHAYVTADKVFNNYWFGGLPAVEKALLEMMNTEAK